MALAPVTAASRQGTVLVYRAAESRRLNTHNAATHAAIARRLATLKGFAFGGEYDPAKRYKGSLYFVPSETLLPHEAFALGIAREDDFFGGIAPQPFAATKTIAHTLVCEDAFAPPGWSQRAACELAAVVLPGFSAFSARDARLAAERILERGPARIKLARGTGGSGQRVVSSRAEVDAALAAIDAAELARYGLVVEQNLSGVVTHSIGETCAAGLRIAYHGRQRVAIDHFGAEVYGGSTLRVLRGDLAALLALELRPEVRLAVRQAMRYDAAAVRALGVIASRRNYDVAQGFGGDRCWRSGVLEQSWKIGGASGAELCALEAFARDPRLHTVQASSHEVYGPCLVPREAHIDFSGVDERVGVLTKYSLVEMP